MSAAPRAYQPTCAARRRSWLGGWPAIAVTLLVAVRGTAQGTSFDERLARLQQLIAARQEEDAALLFAELRREVAELGEAAAAKATADKLAVIAAKADPVRGAADGAAADAAAKVRTVVATYETAGWLRSALACARVGARLGSTEAAATAARLQAALAAPVAGENTGGYAEWFAQGEPITQLRDWRRTPDSLRAPSLGGAMQPAVYIAAQRARSTKLRFAADVATAGNGECGLLFALWLRRCHHALWVLRRGEQMTAKIVATGPDGEQDLAQASLPTPPAGPLHLEIAVDGTAIVAKIGERELTATAAAPLPPGFLAFGARGPADTDFAPTFSNIAVTASPGPSPVDRDDDAPPTTAAPTLPELQTRLAQAQQLAAGADAEAGALALREVRAQLAAVDAQKARALQSAVDAALQKIDPNDAAAQKTFDDAGRDVLRAARAYARRKWHRAALPWFRLACAVSPRVGQQPLAEAQKLVQTAAAPQRQAIAEWFADGDILVGPGSWTVADGVLTSPPLDGASVGYHSKRTTGRDYRIAAGLRSGPDGKVGVVFAAHPGKSQDYYMLELFHDAEVSTLRLFFIKDQEVQTLQTVDVLLTRAECSGFLDFWVQVQGNRIAFGLADLARGEATAVTAELAGAIGCYVSGDSGYRQPVAMRHLRVQQL